MQLLWHASPSVSCFHAAAALLRQCPVHPNLAELTEPAEALRVRLAEDMLAPADFFEHLVPLSAGIESNLQLAEATLTKLLGREFARSRALQYRGLLTDLEKAFDTVVPDLPARLEEALGPLQQAVATYVAPVFHQLVAWTEPQMFVEQADMVALFPALGGSGVAHLRYNSVRIETVPRDPVPALPEWSRAIWLLSLLNLDLPRYGENLRPGRNALVERLAMIPPVLNALADCESTFQSVDLQLAVQTWMELDESPEPVAEQLEDWWQVYLHRRPPFPTALAALDQLLEAVPAA